MKTIYLLTVENKSYSDVLKYYKKFYNLDVAKGTLFNLLDKLKSNGLFDKLFENAKRVKRKIRVFYEVNGNFYSDVDYIQKFIEMRKHSRAKSYTKRVLEGIALTVNRLRKLPHEWSLEDLVQLRNTIYEERLEALKELDEREREVRARNYVYARFLIPIRQILKFLGRDKIVAQLETKGWKVIYSDIEEKKEYLDFEELKRVLNSDLFTHEEKVFMMLEITTGARHYFRSSKAGLLDLRVGDFYEVNGELRCNIREAKTGIVWQGIRVNLLDDLYFKLAGLRLEDEIRRIIKAHRKNERIVEILFGERNLEKKIRSIHKRIEKLLGRRFTPHFMRHTHATLLIRLGISMELIAGKPSCAEFGCGWQDLNTLYTFYVALGQFRYQQEYNMLRSKIRELNL